MPMAGPLSGPAIVASALLFGLSCCSTDHRHRHAM
jgi:hypothetical protein